MPLLGFQLSKEEEKQSKKEKQKNGGSSRLPIMTVLIRQTEITDGEGGEIQKSRTFVLSRE